MIGDVIIEIVRHVLDNLVEIYFPGLMPFDFPNQNSSYCSRPVVAVGMQNVSWRCSVCLIRILGAGRSYIRQENGIL